MMNKIQRQLLEIERRKCVKLLFSEGYKFDCQEDDEVYYSKEGNFTVSINTDEITFFDDNGDFLYLDLSYYGLIGALVSYRQISCNFKKVTDDEVTD